MSDGRNILGTGILDDGNLGVMLHGRNDWKFI
jgi:hypothetical protein